MLKKVFRRQAYYYASAAFIVLWLVYFIVAVNQAYIGINLEDVNDQWIVTSSDPNGDGYQLGIRVGDLILKINDDDPGKYRFVRIWNEVEGAKTILTRRMGQPIDHMVIVTKPLVLQMALSEMPMAFLGFVFWHLGFVAWFKRSFLVQARAFFWLSWLIGLGIVLASASSRGLLWARECELIILSLLPIFLLHFVSVFPHENKHRAIRFGRRLSTFMFVTILILTVLQSTGLIHIFSLLRKLMLSAVIIGILFAIWNLGALMQLPKARTEKNQVSIVLTGIMVGFLPFVLFTAVPILLSYKPLVDAHVSSLFISLIPFTWYYVIVHEYLPDHRRLLGTTISFFVAGVIISFVVSYILITLQFISTINLAVYLSSLTLTMVLIVSFSFIRVVIMKLFGKFAFFEGKQELRQSVLELNKYLTSLNETDRMLEEVMKILAIEGAFMVVEDRKGGYLRNAVGRFHENPSEQTELEECFRAERRISLDVRILPDDAAAAVYIPYVTQHWSCGIFLGQRYSRVKFKRDELPFITLISSQLAQRIEMKLIIKELSKEIKFLAQSASESQQRNHGLQGITTSLFRSLEKERKSLSREIHDGPLQLGLDLNRWLKYINEEISNDEKSVKTIAHMRELIEDLNFELRLICNNLRPPSLTDLGLLPAIELMCEETMSKELMVISLETEGISRDERFKEEVELAAYRFLQEGITNAVKHSGSTRLKVHIAANENKIELIIHDSGKGFDTAKIYDWSLIGTHFGIVGMKERIEILGGDFQISSTLGQGVTLKAVIPISK